jgi:hypothetical protein
MAYGVGVTKRNISGVICAQASTANRDAMTMALAACEIEHVAHDHIFVRIMSPHSIGRVNRFIVKAFQIDGVRAVDRDFTGVDIGVHRTGQPKSLF